MSAPITPSQLLASVPSGTGSLCDRFAAMFRFNQLFHDLFAYERNEQGDITPEACADIQACVGLGTVTPGGGTGGTVGAPFISATDGTLADKVRVTWNAIAGATSYLIYRATADNAAIATQIGTSITTSFDDSTGTIDTIYWYWVKASDGTHLSALSNSDSGYYSTPLPSVTDLDATKGNTSDLNPSPAIWLQWTGVNGATAWDIYRNDADDFATATKIAADRVPFDNSLSLSLGPAPNFVDNGTDLLYIDHPASADKYTKLYYWVVAKKSSPNAVSAESNSANGWAIGFGEGNAPDASTHITDTAEHTVPGAPVRAWIFMYGGGAGGAGGGLTFGGGGGGAGAVLWGQLTVATGGKFKLVKTGATMANAAAETNGQTGDKWELQYKPPAGAYATVMTSDTAGGGVYSATGGGAGGAGSVATLDGVITGGGSKDGVAGMPGMGQKGGRSGHNFASYRVPPAHFDGVAGFNGDFEGGGSGSVAINPNVAAATGGKALPAVASIVYSNT